MHWGPNPDRGNLIPSWWARSDEKHTWRHPRAMNVILRNSQPLLRRISNGRSNLQQSRSFAAGITHELLTQALNTALSFGFHAMKRPSLIACLAWLKSSWPPFPKCRCSWRSQGQLLGGATRHTKVEGGTCKFIKAIYQSLGTILRPSLDFHCGLLQIVLTVLATWGIVIYSSLKIFGGKKEVTAPTEGAAQTAPAHWPCWASYESTEPFLPLGIVEA